MGAILLGGSREETELLRGRKHNKVETIPLPKQMRRRARSEETFPDS